MLNKACMHRLIHSSKGRNKVKTKFKKIAVISALLIVTLIIAISLVFNQPAAPAPELSAPDTSLGDSNTESTTPPDTSTPNSEGSTYTLILTPKNSADPVGTTHTVTATVTNNSNPVPDISVAFQITSGPNMGLNGLEVTNSSGQAIFSWSSSVVGTDTLNATIEIGDQLVYDVATESWIPNFNVIPEVPFGTIAISAALLMSLSLFVMKNKRILKI